MTVTVTSSTDTPEVVKAVQDAANTPKGEKDKGVSKSAVSPTEKKADESSQDSATSGKEGEGDGKKSSDSDSSSKKDPASQRAIKKAKAEAQKWRDEAMRREGFNAALNKSGNQVTEKKEVVVAEPQLKDFEDVAAYTKAMIDYKVAEALKKVDNKITEKTTEQEAKGAFKEKLQGWGERQEEARERYDDYDAVFTEDVPCSPVMRDYFIDSELGADVAYYLCKHPDEAKKIAELVGDAAAERKANILLGKIEAKVELQLEAASKKAEETEEEEEEAGEKTGEKKAAAEPFKKLTEKDKHKPVNPPRGGDGGNVKKDFSKPGVPYQDWLANRNKTKKIA